MNLDRCANPKPLPGEYALAKKQRALDADAHERREMHAALVRDGMKCRVPRCAFKGLRIEACHLREQHRGMGGNPAGDRTQRKLIIALCVRHHYAYDKARTLDIEETEPDKGFDGLCAFYLDGHHVGTEKRIGVSVTRSVR